GVSAIGHVGKLYIQSQKTLPQYEEFLDRGMLPTHRGVIMSDDDTLRGDVIQQIMCHGKVDIAATERRYGIEFDAYFGAELRRMQPLVADGLGDCDVAR